MTVTGSEVKTKGVSLFEKLLDGFGEVIINVRGKDKFCVIPYEEYEAYRAYKLEQAHKEVMADIEKGKYHTDPNRHFAAIEEALK